MIAEFPGHADSGPRQKQVVMVPSRAGCGVPDHVGRL